MVWMSRQVSRWAVFVMRLKKRWTSKNDSAGTMRRSVFSIAAAKFLRWLYQGSIRFSRTSQRHSSKPIRLFGHIGIDVAQMPQKTAIVTDRQLRLERGLFVTAENFTFEPLTKPSRAGMAAGRVIWPLLPTVASSSSMACMTYSYKN